MFMITVAGDWWLMAAAVVAAAAALVVVAAVVAVVAGVVAVASHLRKNVHGDVERFTVRCDAPTAHIVDDVEG